MSNAKHLENMEITKKEIATSLVSTGKSSGFNNSHNWYGEFANYNLSFSAIRNEAELTNRNNHDDVILFRAFNKRELVNEVYNYLKL